MADIFSAPSDEHLTKVDVKENRHALVFVAELPGINDKDVAVELDGRTLTICGHRQPEEDADVDSYVHIERDSRDIRRSFIVDFPVKPECIQAQLADGLLTIVVPKPVAHICRQIPIQIL